jgi:hypothetical protein
LEAFFFFFFFYPSEGYPADARLTTMRRPVSEPVSKNDPRYEEIKKRMGNPVGDFSLSRLFMQVQGRAEFYREGCDFRGRVDWSRESDVVRRGWADITDVWASRMRNGWHTTISYRMTTSRPETVNAHAPTFPPTSITYTTYPWIDPYTGKKKPGDEDNRFDATALCPPRPTSS